MMKELPKQDQPEAEVKKTKSMPILPLNTDPTSYSTSNRRAPGCPIQRLYPWLLFASTAVAATFCLAYISKPVILAAPTSQQQESLNTAASANSTTSKKQNTLLPNQKALPGSEENSNKRAAPSAPLTSDFEETNIRIQHVLDAEFPSGDVSRIIVDVPVLYRSRNLRWTQNEAARARVLLNRLAAYQNQVRNLRSEGTQLLDEWNSLMTGSIPGEALRADSPSLPANQRDDLLPIGQRATDTVDTIKLQNTEK